MQRLALVIRHEAGDGFIRGDGPQLIMFLGAGDEIAMGVGIHAVAPAGRFQEGGKPPVHRPFQDAVVGLVGEKHVSLGVTGGPLGEGEGVRQLFQFRPRRHEGFSQGRRLPEHQQGHQNSFHKHDHG